MSTGSKSGNLTPSGYANNFNKQNKGKTGMMADRDSYVAHLENQLKQQNKGSNENQIDARSSEFTVQVGHLETKINNLTKLHKLAQNLQEAQENEYKKDKEDQSNRINELETKLQRALDEKKKLAQKFATLENLIVELIDKRNSEKKTPKKDPMTESLARTVELLETEFRTFRQSVADRLDSLANMLNNQAEQREQDFERISYLEANLQKESAKRMEAEREQKRNLNEPATLELIQTVNRKVKNLEEALQIQIKPDIVELKRAHDNTKDELINRVTKIEAVQHSTQSHKADSNLIRSLESQANVFQKEISYLKMREKKHLEDINASLQDIQEMKQILKGFQNFRTESTNSWKLLEKRIDNKVEKFTSEIDNLVTLQKQLQEYYANAKYEETNAHLKQEQRRLDEQLELCISKINTLVEMHNQTRIQLKDNYRLLNQVMEKEKLGTPIASSAMTPNLSHSGKKLKFSSDLITNDRKEIDKKDVFEQKLSDPSHNINPIIKKGASKVTMSSKMKKKELKPSFNKSEPKPSQKDHQQTPTTEQKKRQKILRDIYRELQELETSEDDL